MTETEKVDFYNRYQQTIRPKLRHGLETKPLWRRLYWTTGRDSNEYKAGCVEMLEAHFPELFINLSRCINSSTESNLI